MYSPFEWRVGFIEITMINFLINPLEVVKLLNYYYRAVTVRQVFLNTLLVYQML